MRYRSVVFVAILMGLGLLITSCVQQKPEGPAERIGKGLDEIIGAIDDYDATRRLEPTPRSEPPARDYDHDSRDSYYDRDFDYERKDPYAPKDKDLDLEQDDSYDSSRY